jgi:hypothetical protein
MKSDKNSEKKQARDIQTGGEFSHPLLPKVTSDEIDLYVDTARDEEIAQDKPPHHN